MSQENVETIREMFAVVNERGVKAATDALGHLLAPDFGLRSFGWSRSRSWTSARRSSSWSR